MSEASTEPSSPPKPLPSPEIPAVTEPSTPEQNTSLQQPPLLQELDLQLRQQLQMQDRWQQLLQKQLLKEQKDRKMYESSTASSSASKPLPSPEIPAVTESSAPEQNTSLQQPSLLQELDLLLLQQLQIQDRRQQLLQKQLLKEQKDRKMYGSSTASSSASKPLPSPEIPAVTEPSATKQNSSLLQKKLKQPLLLTDQQLLYQQQLQNSSLQKQKLKQPLVLTEQEQLHIQLQLYRQQQLQNSSLQQQKFKQRPLLPCPKLLLKVQKDPKMPESSTASSSLSKPLPLPKIPAVTEPLAPEQNTYLRQQQSLLLQQMQPEQSQLLQKTQQLHRQRQQHLKQSLQLQKMQLALQQTLLQKQQLLQEEQDFNVKGGIIGNNLSGLLNFQDLQGKFPARKWPDEMQGNNKHQQQQNSAIDALGATQGQNAPTSELTQNGSVVQNAVSPQPWFKQVIDAGPIIQQCVQLQPQRMMGLGDQKPLCLTGSQPDDATPGWSSSYGTEASRKRMIHDVVSQLDLNGNLDPEVRDHLSEIAGNFIDSVAKLARTLIKHPESPTPDSKDVLLHPGGTKQENSKNSVRDLSDCKPQAVYCHCGLEATPHTASTQSKQGTGFWCCSKLGAERCGFFEWCDPEMIKRCNETMPGILRRMNAHDATINDLKTRHRELCMALVICVLVMLFMVWDRFVQG